MCKNCQYKVRDALKEKLSDDSKKCFICIGLAGNEEMARATTFLIKAIVSNWEIDKVVDRLVTGLRRDTLSADSRLAYKSILRSLEVISDTPQTVSAPTGVENEPKSDEWGGLWD